MKDGNGEEWRGPESNRGHHDFQLATSFDAYLWQFVDGAPIVGHRQKLRDLPSQTQESKAMSKDLKRRGFRFIGPMVCYAFMQATGLVNDHVTTCFRYREPSH